MFGRQNGAESAKKVRVKIHEATLENDIRYLGPLSSAHFRVLGWLCLIVAQVVVLVRLGGRVNADFAADSASWLSILEEVAGLALPFLLITSFALIINTEDGFKRQLLINGGAMAGICGLFYLMFYRYIVGGVATFLADPSEAMPLVETGLGYVAPYGFFAFNIFVDLFLCALTMLFLNYNPRRVFTGKARFLFRLLALLPIGYEVGCMLLKVYAARGLAKVPVWAWPLLTVKPPMTFLLFVVMALFVKTRELRFRRHGKAHEDYLAFLKTRRNALHFSVFLAIMMAVVSLLDLAVVIGFSLNEIVVTASTSVEQSVSAAEARAAEIESTLSEVRAKLERAGVAPEATKTALASLRTMLEDGEVPPEAVLRDMLAALEGYDGQPGAAEAAPGDAASAPEDPAANHSLSPEKLEALMRAAYEEALSEESINASLEQGIRIAEAVGFGNSIYLIFLAPVVLLFCYTRRPKHPLLDLLIPVAGVILIVFVYLEGGHRLLGLLPVEKVNLEELRQMFLLYSSMAMQPSAF